MKEVLTRRTFLKSTGIGSLVMLIFPKLSKAAQAPSESSQNSNNSYDVLNLFGGREAVRKRARASGINPKNVYTPESRKLMIERVLGPPKFKDSKTKQYWINKIWDTSPISLQFATKRCGRFWDDRSLGVYTHNLAMQELGLFNYF